MFEYDRETMRKIRMAFRGQKCMANKRGIKMLFTFVGWVEWWECQKGPEWYKVCARKGMYVMARDADLGNYEESNVSCVLHEDNGRVMAANGKSPVGEKNGRSIITAKNAAAIFKSYEDDDVLAARFKCTPFNVRCIQRGKSWRHVTDLLPPRRPRGDKRKKLTDEQVREIALMKGSRQEIAEKFGVAPVTVWEIQHGKKRAKALVGIKVEGD